jgi:hypothetical protein
VTEVLFNQPVAATLGASLTSGATSLTLATGDGGKFPAVGRFHAGIAAPDGSNFEIVEVGGVAGDTLTGLVRGREGTVAVAHASGDTIEVQPTAASFYRVVADARGWGVTMDGATDDAAALNAAMAAVSAAGGGEIRLGPGTCLCTALTPQPDVTLSGAGMRATTIKLKNATNASLLTATSAHRFVLRDLTLDGNKANNTGAGNWNGLFLTTSDDVRVHRVRVLNADWIGLAFAGCANPDVSECLIDAPDYIGVWFGISGTTHCTGARLSRCRMIDCGLDGCIADSDDVLMLGNFVQGTGRLIHASGLYVSPGRYRVRIEGNHCEGTSGHGIDFDTSSTDDSYGCVCVGNVCIFNRDAGIGCDSNGCVIAGNYCANNGFAQGVAGAYPYGIIADGKYIVVTGNRCTDTQASKTQTYGISLRNVSTVTASCRFVGNELTGNVNAGINGLTSVGSGHAAYANTGAPDLVPGNVAIASLVSDHKLVLESAANDHLRLIRTGNGYVYESYVDSTRVWMFQKPVGNTGSSLNALFKFSLIGGIDSLNPYWNGLHFQGHTITEGGTNRFPILGFYSRSAAAADPTDFEFVFELSNAGTLPASMQYKVPDIAGAYSRWLFGSTERMRLNRAGDLVLSQIATPSAPAAGFTSLYTKSDGGVYIRPTGGAETALAQGTDTRFMSFIEPDMRIFYPLIPTSGTFALVSGTGYWVYLGRLVTAATPKFVEFLVTTVGAGAQTAEVGLFSTPTAPSKAAQSLTKLVSTATVDSLTTTGVKRNTTAFAVSVPAGTHLWAGIRTAMATTQPTLRGLMDDWSEGGQLALAAAGALTGAGPWAGALVAVNLTAAQGPALRVTMD